MDFLHTSGFGYQQYLAIMKALMYSDSVMCTVGTLHGPYYA